mmetsp:Transcript_43368/g.102120  ORF Transcript_43368/g.102120 Transcript_43368/m.102120 type:complete len:80 (+) Transcript_43368:1229-1468(+)
MFQPDKSGQQSNPGSALDHTARAADADEEDDVAGVCSCPGGMSVAWKPNPKFSEGVVLQQPLPPAPPPPPPITAKRPVS